jgi:hypothetical protein
MRCCLALFAIPLAACADNAPGASALVSDSAGVKIVEYRASTWESGQEWRISREPLLEIGMGDGPESYQFFNLKGAVRLSDGRIVAANGGSGELRYFDSKGVFLHSVGGEGEGPGEFRSLDFVARLPGDSVLTYDPGLLRIQIFGPTGQFARSLQTESPWPGMYRPPVPAGVLNARTVVATLSNVGVGFKEGLGRTPEILATVDLHTGRVDSLATILGLEQIVTPTERGFSMGVYTFGNYSDVAVGVNRIATVSTEAFAVNILDPQGTLVAKVNKDAQPIEVTPQDVEAYIEASLAKWPPGMSDQAMENFRRRVRQRPVAPYLPLLRSVHVDSDGNLWAESFPRPGTGDPPFIVLGTDGTLLGEVYLPPGLDRGTHATLDPLLELGADYVLGVWSDELGVEVVRLYGLIKPDR